MWIKRRGLVVAAGAVLAFVLCACSPIEISRSGPGEAGVSPPPAPRGSLHGVPITTLDIGVRSGISTPRQVVVRDEVAWEDLWAEHTTGRASVPVPNVDFGSQMVLAVFLGEKPSSGYAVTILDAAERDGNLVVDVEVSVPPAGMSELTILTYPYHMVMVPQTEGRVEFATTETTRPRAR